MLLCTFASQQIRAVMPYFLWLGFVTPLPSMVRLRAYKSIASSALVHNPCTGRNVDHAAVLMSAGTGDRNEFHNKENNLL